MFDDDDLFDLTDDPFEWDMLLDDDELEQDRKKRRGTTYRRRMTSAAVDCLVGSLGNRCAQASVY